MAQVVYLIGVTATGKTTIASEWQKAGGVILPEFNIPVSEYPDYVMHVWHQDLEGRKKSQKWVFNEMKKKNEQLRALVNQSDSLIVTDRSIWDVWAYSMALGSEVGEMTEVDIASVNWVPGKTILLSASEATRKQRWLVNRGIPESEWTNHWKPLADKLTPYYEHLKGKFGLPTIDTTNLTVNQMMESFHRQAEGAPIFNLEGVVDGLPSGKEIF